MKHFSFFVAVLALTASCATTSAAVKTAVVPQPAEMTVLSGTLTLPATVAVSGPDSLADRLTANASFFPGIELRRTSSGAGRITFTADPALPAEGYSLTVSPDDIDVKAADRAGAFYAVQTLRQLYDYL